jgi:hypothetical protein
LYRLLNYIRNPFLPPFPSAFNFQDEDKAFAERMKGAVPALPALGGEAIGRVVIKAISPRNDRFGTATEFRSSLERALSITEQEVLAAKVNFMGAPAASARTDKTVSETKNDSYAETVAEAAPAGELSATINESGHLDLHKGLFDTVGETPSTSVPDALSGAAMPMAQESTPPRDDAPIIFTPTIETGQPKAIDPNVISKAVCIAPIGIALIGIIAYFAVIPNIYSKAVSFIDWLFTDPQNIISALKDPNTVLPQVHSIIGIRIFWWAWLATFIASLFFAGRQLQKKPEPNVANALLLKRDAYFIMQKVLGGLNSAKQRISEKEQKELDALIRNVKKLEEKLSVESDFGYGRSAVIECENSIAKQLQFLRDALPYIENGNLGENISKMNTAATNVANLLRQRTELKKL